MPSKKPSKVFNNYQKKQIQHNSTAAYVKQLLQDDGLSLFIQYIKSTQLDSEEKYQAACKICFLLERRVIKYAEQMEKSKTLHHTFFSLTKKLYEMIDQYKRQIKNNFVIFLEVAVEVVLMPSLQTVDII